MSRINRRRALVSLYGFALTACGGGASDLPQGASASLAPSDLAAGTSGTNLPASPGVGTGTIAPVPRTGDLVQARTWDAGSGPNPTMWSRHLQLAWKHQGGDWTDAAGVAQGAVPFATLRLTAAGPATIDITALARRWLGGHNTGAMVRLAARAAKLAGRQSATPPRLVVTAGGVSIDCVALACSNWTASTANGLDSRVSIRLDSSSAAILQFDLSGVSGAIDSAVLHLSATAADARGTDLLFFDTDAPLIHLGQGPAMPGLAAAVGEAGLKGHPDVIAYHDFATLEGDVDWMLLKTGAPYEITAEGYRGSFDPSSHGSFNGIPFSLRADLADPRRPPLGRCDELFVSLDFLLEDDFVSSLDQQKLGVGFDLRMGYWNDAQGGYWQNVSGNGGDPGDGRAHLRGDGRLEFRGHSIRMEAGKDADDGNPYGYLRPLQSYVYHLDQPTNYGDMKRLGAGCIQRGRWNTIEQRIKLNSVSGARDALGNGEAVADGVLQTWLNGNLISTLEGLRWRHNELLGVNGGWINWYYGGQGLPPQAMHYRQRRMVVARRYVGPRPV
jgi:hypothetical protein